MTAPSTTPRPTFSSRAEEFATLHITPPVEIRPKRLLVKARRLAAQHSAPPPLASSAPLAEHIVPCWQARCWAALNPPTGVTLYDEVLHTWPGGRTRDGGLYLARLALACAQAGDLDRARTEGRKALAIARTTDSQVTARELTTLTTALRTDNNEHT